MLLGVAEAAVKMFGVLPELAVEEPDVSTVLTAMPPAGGFLAGTTTLLIRRDSKRDRQTFRQTTGLDLKS